MNAQPGWYDAGVPGVQRWWDGAQWTVHERGGESVWAAAQPIQHPASAAPMGWFPVVGTSDVRWWDGAGWTPYRLRDGRPRPDAFAIEPGGNGLVLGLVFIVLGITQFSTAQFLDGQPFFAFTPVLFLVAGALWLIGGFRTRQLTAHPAPSTPPVFDASIRPLPGEAEGTGAGWFAVSGGTRRWWTGARWSPYIHQRIGVRPTQYGERAYRIALSVGWVFAGLGALGTVLGFVLIYALGRWVGVAIVVPGLIGLLIGGLVVVLTYIRRYTMILPSQAPPLD